MKVIYICSPYRASNEDTLHKNINYAKELTRKVLLQGDCPIATHLYMTQCLDEDVMQERKIGLVAGREILQRCDLVLVGKRYGLSQGMKAEIDRALQCGIPILFDET